MDRTGWTTAVGDVGEGLISVRGYRLEELIRHLPFAGVVYLTIRGELPSPEQTRVMEAVLGSIVEHGFYSPTTAAGRMVASASPESIISGLAGALLTIGSVTVSPQHSAELILEGLDLRDRRSISEEKAAEEVVNRLVGEGRRMPGVGHPLHPEGDPRAIALREVAVENEVWGARGSMFETMVGIFRERTGRSLPINIDGMLACVMSELGFRPLEMPGVAAISFMPGIIAHNVEEIESGRKLRVVEGEYTGPAVRDLPPTDAFWRHDA